MMYFIKYNYWKTSQTDRLLIVKVKLNTMHIFSYVDNSLWAEYCILFLTMSNLRRTKPELSQPKLGTTKLDEISPCWNYLCKLWIPWYYLILLFSDNLTKISNCRSLPVLSLAPFSSKSFHLPAPYEWLSDFSNLTSHSNSRATDSPDIPYFSTGYSTTPQLSNSKPFTFKRNAISNELMYSHCLLFISHSCPPLFYGSFPILATFNYSESHFHPL